MASSSAGDLFRALDGRSVTVSYRRWRIEVYSMLEQQGWRWVQLRLRGDPDRCVIVKIPDRDGEAEVIDGLLSWLSNPSRSNEQVLNLD